MKRLAGMQPYFFPYIGYWQLINAVDIFVLFDEAQYIKQGWVNRNRILRPEGGWQYIRVPIKKHSMTESIKNVQIHQDGKWKELIIRQLAHYKKKAKYFNDTNDFVKDAIFSNTDQSIGAINCNITKKLCAYLGVETKIVISSEHNFNYSDINAPGDWALQHSEQLGAIEVINPIDGAALFNCDKFSLKNIKLSFFKSNEITYPQSGAFESSLSIIDVLMFNGIERTKELLKKYSIQTVE